jgi:hypothetical protein
MVVSRVAFLPQMSGKVPGEGLANQQLLHLLTSPFSGATVSALSLSESEDLSQNVSRNR